MKKNKKALSLVIAIGLTLVMSVLGLYILEYIVPFSKNTKNIEKSVEAYYQADSAIEDALLSNNNDNLEEAKRLDYGTNIKSSGSVLPPNGEGNSEFDNDSNSIRIGQAIKLEIGNNSIEPGALKLFIKLPDINKKYPETLSGGVNNKIINWQLSSDNNVLNSNGSEINVSDINNGSFLLLQTRNGRDLNDITNKNFESFYNDNCKGTGSGCRLKLSVINRLEGKINGNNTNFPYLEWKITTGIKSIPLRYKIIETTGKSSEYRKTLKVKVPGKKLNDAYDFALFQ